MATQQSMRQATTQTANSAIMAVNEADTLVNTARYVYRMPRTSGHSTKVANI